jgi:deoxyadenosine/deoxycytidine kinase
MPAPLIAVVGVCGAGKTTLVASLRGVGWNVRQELQEHSYVPYMWQRLSNPDVLIYLDATLETIRRRRRDPDFPPWLLEQEIKRLRHARQYCDYYLDTDPLTPEEVLESVLAWLTSRGLTAAAS